MGTPSMAEEAEGVDGSKGSPGLSRMSRRPPVRQSRVGPGMDPGLGGVLGSLMRRGEGLGKVWVCCDCE